jgi:hypothetical protein
MEDPARATNKRRAQRDRSYLDFVISRFVLDSLKDRNFVRLLSDFLTSFGFSSSNLGTINPLWSTG